MKYEVHYHADMLSDKVRLESFRKAINEVVEENDIAVDIGTGILASYACKRTKHKGYALEYFSSTAEIAKTMFEKNSVPNVTALNCSSFSKPIDITPDVVISETIGRLGPEDPSGLNRFRLFQ
ncbi:hypothetical protein [Gynuella sp.]|uniref:hypothetical protein n=1 Tax=Gynuella sp. TaxID=2969146 RepID=UPI003D0EAEFF